MYRSIFNYLPQIDLNDNLWIMFKGRGLLVSHKALDDWSVISQGKSSGCTATMMTMRQVHAIEWLVNQASNEGGVTGRGYLAVVFLSELEHCCWYMIMAISSVAERIEESHGSNTNNPTLKTNLNIYVIIIISLTVLNGTAAILSSQTWPY